MIKTFKGKARWARIWKPDDKYDNYTIDLLFDQKSLLDFKAAKTQLKLKEDDEGQPFVSFKRRAKTTNKEGEVEDAGPPTVYILDSQSGEYIKANDRVDIGNGSDVILSVDVFSTKNGVGTRLERVFVTNLIEYNPGPVDEPGQVDLPF